MLKYEPKLSRDHLIKVAKKFMQITGRDFDAEYQDYLNETLSQVREEVVDVMFSMQGD
jgi:hypothetical protein